MKVAITTVDNPFSPFDEFDEWNEWDIQKGYHSNSYLSRLVPALDDYDDDFLVEEAIDEIIKYNPKVYKKVYNKNQENVYVE